MYKRKSYPHIVYLNDKLSRIVSIKKERRQIVAFSFNI